MQSGGALPPFFPALSNYSFPPFPEPDPDFNPPELLPELPLQDPHSPSHSLRIKLPPMAPNTRATARQRTSSLASDSEYHESNASANLKDDYAKVEEEESEPKAEYVQSHRGRKVAKKSYKDLSDDEILIGNGHADDDEDIEINGVDDDGDDEANVRRPRYSLRHSRSGGAPNGIVVSDDEGGASLHTRPRARNSNKIHASTSNQNANSNGRRPPRRSGSRRQAQSSRSNLARPSMSTRRTRSSHNREQESEDGYVDEPSSGSADADGSLDATATSPDPEPEGDVDGEGDADGDGEVEQEAGQDGRPYALRQRVKINYAIPPPLEEMRPPPKNNRPTGGRANGRSGGGFGNGRSKAPGWSATGAELSRWMGGGNADDSVCIICFLNTPHC